MVAERVLISICVYSLLKSTVSTFLGLLPIFFLSFFFFSRLELIGKRRIAVFSNCIEVCL